MNNNTKEASFLMKTVEKEQFLFIDDDGQEKIFLRGKYFEFVCATITDFFHEKIIENDFYLYFVSFLNALEGYNDVDFINYHLPCHWALCIIQNKHTTESPTSDELRNFIKFSSQFDKNNDVESFIINTETV